MRASVDMRRLEQFVAVAREGSLGKAAIKLALAQPTLTRNIRSLEQEVGATLFHRGPLGTVLTAAGERFVTRAEALLNDFEHAVAELEDNVPRTQLRIGISPNFFFDLLPPAIAALIDADPSVNVQLVTGTRETIAEDLRRNAIDLGLCLIPDFIHTAGQETNEIRFEAFGTDHILPFARPGHPSLAARDMSGVEGSRWAVPHALSVSYRFESAFYRHHLPVPVQSLNATSLSLLREAAISMDFISLLPARFARQDVQAGRLAPLSVDALAFDATMGFMYRAGRSLAPAASHLVDIVRQTAAASA
ncbi:MAG: LysR family transcriptional regulator [Sphingobium sp.]